MSNVKRCTGCDMFSSNIIGDKFLSCCPDSRYIDYYEWCKKFGNSLPPSQTSFARSGHTDSKTGL